LFLILLFQREDLFRIFLFLLRLKPPRLKIARTEMMPKVHWGETSSTTSPPPAHSEDLGLDRKRKHVEELLSSSTSAPKNVAGEASALEDEEELFDLLDS
jgi:hypothetical protein